MNISNYYWYFTSALTPKFCDEVIKYANAQKETMAITGGYGRERDLNKKPLNKEEIKDLKRKRNSDLVWLNDKWIYKELHPYVHEANRNAGWNCLIYLSGPESLGNGTSFYTFKNNTYTINSSIAFKENRAILFRGGLHHGTTQVYDPNSTWIDSINIFFER